MQHDENEDPSFSTATSTSNFHRPPMQRSASKASASSAPGLDAVVRNPLGSLQGSMRLKVSRSIQKNALKGQEDYSSSLRSASGQLNYLKFLTTHQSNPGLEDDDKVFRNHLKLQEETLHSVSFRLFITSSVTKCKVTNNN